MQINRHAAKSLERQQLKSIRRFYYAIADINLALADIHKKIQPNIDEVTYKHATAYINQYISYTTVWNMKFAYNIESPEVAMLQLFHLRYIFQHEPVVAFIQERQLVQEQQQSFDKLQLFTNEQLFLRYEKMLKYIDEQKEL
ncbi:hypothetical protein P9B03_08795 [Metasolibacillus meyeri]|uniref:Uncharacterized protein n=1 Tax=Metasolibacillus meyeri TaxID=1071052 RepID=A0AAW9NLR3_9BACL|nr:hypothetical protein [Metasolibacillus meyeri]MEC1178577.1 hypothetical protein [Metasolibacillus meyeri]